MTTLERALKIKPADAEAALFLGLARLGQGETKNATETLTKVIATPDAPKVVTARAHAALGDLAYDAKRDADADAHYAQALKLDPALGVAALALGALRAQAGKKPEAKLLFESAAKNLPPGSLRSRACAALGRLAEEAKDTVGAKSWAAKALINDPTNPWAKKLVGK